MKQVTILSIKDFEAELQAVLKGLEIPVFSKVNIDGYKNTRRSADLSNWFAGSIRSDFSVMYFSFVNDDVANKILDAIQVWNAEMGSQNSMHAYLLPIERSV
ncbi:hypothetical protein [Reichenbachiella sp.]|uniref:hypothetical protein n=1 Tax=Reichenbachiella sp. TaxID=2184521 RepID=UPI003B5AE5EB